MPAEEQTRLQIGHVLFIDIVGYSKLLVNQQSDLLRELNELVSSTNEFREAEAAGKLIRLPTGDGMALVFRTDPEAPAQCALEIARALKEHPRIALRMGIHSGPVNEVVDVNQRQNIAGAGINMAQRVMDCGDAGHILVSKHVAEDLEQHEQWRPLLHDLGTCEVKHGVRIGIANLYDSEVGNAQLPKKLKAVKRLRTQVRWAAVAVALLVLGAIVGGQFLFLRRPIRSVSGIVEKSIAVFPFENLSEEKANGFFAEGVQDQILTNLAQIADLKVISRTSVMQYKSDAPRNLRKIGEELGVARVVEGSVQRAANKIRVNAQLIDARNDAHLWAQTYDRDLADVFAIQSEIAQSIANELQAKISPSEKAAIEEQPTKDLAAYDLYARATGLIDRAAYGGDERKDFFQAVDLLNQAVARDPSFLLAYCRLAEGHDALYFHDVDRTPNRLALAKAAIDAAFRLKPDSGEAHLALAAHLYFGYFDYDRARDELTIALRTLPNNARIFEWSAYIDRRENRWHDAVRNVERAVELDPRNVRILADAAVTYRFKRDYGQFRKIIDRLTTLEPNDIGSPLWRAWVDVWERGDLRPVQAVVEKNFTAYGPLRFGIALWGRNPVAADYALAATTDGTR